MTKEELSILLGHNNREDVNKCFIKAEKICPSIKLKKNDYNCAKSIDYTLEECLIALTFLKGFTPMVSRYVKEHFVERNGGHAYKDTLTLTKTAATFVKSNARIQKCCAKCLYLAARSFNTQYSRLYPYCTWYKVFLNKVTPKMRIYTTACPTYQYSHKSPLVWTSAGVFTLDRIKWDGNEFSIIENKETTLGLPNSMFKTKHRKGDPIVILKDMYMEEN